MKIFVGLMTVGVVLGLLATKSVLYAGEAEQVQRVELQGQVNEDDVDMQNVRTALYEILAKDEQYTAAEAAVETYDGADELEYIMLEGDRVQLARSIYEENFGPWEGNVRELVAFLVVGKESDIGTDTITACGNTAIRVCGAGKVKSVTVTKKGCSFVCGTPT